LNAKRSDPNDSAEQLIKAATEAYLDGDYDFFAACETRWVRVYAPFGPSLRELIALARSPSDDGGESR
jgi:hypothetical protein